MDEEILQFDHRHQPPAISLRDVVAPLFRHRRLVALSFLVVLLGAFVAAFAFSPKFEAEMKILVKRERFDPMVTADRTTVIESRPEVTEEDLQSEVELLKSRDLLEEVALSSGLAPARNAPATSASSVTMARAVQTLQKHLQIEPLKKTNLISATYQSRDPVLAARVLNNLAALYLEKHLAVHRLPGAFDFFQKQTDRYRDELIANEANLTEFNRSARVVSPELEKEITLRKLYDFDATLKQTQADISETTERVHSLESQMSTAAPRIATQERTGDNPPLLANLKATLLELQLKRNELITKFAPDYPLVQQVEAQIALTKTAIADAEHSPVQERTTDSDPTYAWLREELTKNRTDLVALHARADALTPVVNAYQAKARGLDQSGSAQQDLVRATKAAEDSYLLYLQKQEEARISDALDRNRMVNVAIAEAATVPALPVRSPVITLLLGTLIAAFVGVGSAFCADYLDPSIRTTQELHDTLEIPLLAAVPREARIQ